MSDGTVTPIGTRTPDWLKAADEIRGDLVSRELDDVIESNLRAGPDQKAVLAEPLKPAVKKRPAKKSPAPRGLSAAARARAEAEAKRAKPLDPQRRGVLITALVMAGIIFVTSALFSFATVAAAAEWMRPPWPALVWVVPGFVEAFIIWFGFDAIISQARGRAKDARSALVWMFVFASVGVIANAAHTVAEWGSDFSSTWTAWIGTGMSALAPLSVVLITKRVSRLVFLNPDAQ